jgi:sporulation protein YlmC with PRC-barrel domain
MFKLIPGIAVASLLAVSAAVAQTNPPSTATPADPPAAAPASPSTSTPAATDPSSSTMSDTGPMMTDADAKAWVNKTVYSSDGKNVGEVSEVIRDNSGHVTELHADIGGFLGLGETRVRVAPDAFKLASDRVILNLPADQAKSLPHIAK